MICISLTLMGLEMFTLPTDILQNNIVNIPYFISVIICQALKVLIVCLNNASPFLSLLLLLLLLLIFFYLFIKAYVGSGCVFLHFSHTFKNERG